MLKRIILLLLLTTIYGCATAPVSPRPDRSSTVETLQSPVNISLTSPGGKISGNGILFFHAPDSYRLSILAPFGQIIMEMFVNDGRATIVAPSRKAAWNGALQNLPETLGLRAWSLMGWVTSPVPPAGAALQREFTGPEGLAERIIYGSDGLAQKKIRSSGEELTFGDYRPVDGVPFAHELQLTTSDNAKLRLLFDEPEINRTLEEGTFTPSLDGYTVLPLQEFKGF